MSWGGIGVNMKSWQRHFSPYLHLPLYENCSPQLRRSHELKNVVCCGQTHRWICRQVYTSLMVPTKVFPFHVMSSSSSSSSIFLPDVQIVYSSWVNQWLPVVSHSVVKGISLNLLYGVLCSELPLVSIVCWSYLLEYKTSLFLDFFAMRLSVIHPLLAQSKCPAF